MSLKLLTITWFFLIILGTITAVQIGRIKILKDERDQAISFSLAKDDSIQRLQTKLGQAAVKSQVLDLTIENLKRLQEDKELAWIKQIEGINKRMNNVEQISSTTARVIGSFKIGLRDSIRDSTIIVNDSFFIRAFDNEDKWFRLRGYVTADTLVAQPELNINLQSVVYWERKRKFLGIRVGRKEWFKQTTTDNPYVTIMEDKLIRISKKPK